MATLAGDGIVQVAGVDTSESEVKLLFQAVEQACDLLGGAGIALVDVAARVAAVHLGNVELEVDEVGRSSLGGVVEVDERLQTAGAPDGDDAVVLAVEVEQVVALQHVALDVDGTGEAGLLIDGGEHLERAALDVVVEQGSQGQSQAHAVVGAQRGAVGAHPLAVDHSFDGVGLKVMV